MSSNVPSSTPAATPGGNGFEIVCDLVGHSVLLSAGLHMKTEEEMLLLMTALEVAHSKEIVCERCQKTLVVRLYHTDLQGLFMVAKEKECTA